MNTEKTELQSGVQNSEMQNQEPAQSQVRSESIKIQSNHIGRKVAIGMTSGVLMGSVASAASVAAIPEVIEVIDLNDEVVTGELEYPEWSDGEIALAENVSDEMSFGEAFAAAREEVGPGGAFVWRGNIYNTFTAEEWDALSDEQIAEFGSHFDFSAVDGPDTIDPIESEPVQAYSEPIEEGQIAPDVELYGVVTDEESGVNVGLMTIEDDAYYLVDADGDGGEFELVVHDANHDGFISENEIYDISADHIGVEEFACHSLGDDDMYASADDADYLADDYVNNADVDDYMYNA